ncbi:MAG: hypothetical protein B6242_15350 [Anaerolineaceae bacterium 4572_78]|nr:MAG: hypothetical protein B6242_15350 [Anaerolineaceae bacterium 4572_78]
MIRQEMVLKPFLVLTIHDLEDKMRPSTVPKDAYTDSPDLHPSLILGSLQLFFWLFFRPSAWHNYLQRLDPNLYSNCYLLQLNKLQLRSLYDILKHYLVLCIMLTVLFTPFAILIKHSLGKTDVFADMLMCWGYLLSGVVIISAVVSLNLGLIYGMFMITFAFILPDSWLVSMYGLSAGFIGMAYLIVTYKLVDTLLAKQLIVVIITFLIVSIVLLAIYLIINEISISDLLQAIKNKPDTKTNQQGEMSYGLQSGLVYGGIQLLVIWWYTKRLGLSTIYASMTGLILGVSYVISVSSDNTYMSYVSLGINGGLLFGGLFIIGYIIVNKLGGITSGIIGGVFSSGLTWVLLKDYIFMHDTTVIFVPIELAVLISLICILLSLLFHFLRNSFFYPLEVLYNFILYHSDKEKNFVFRIYTKYHQWYYATPETPATLLQYHTAFWDDLQTTLLPRLDKHLFLALQRNHDEGMVAIDYLNKKPYQKQSTKLITVELDMQTIATCTDIQAISQVHHDMNTRQFPEIKHEPITNFYQFSRDIEKALNHQERFHQQISLSEIQKEISDLIAKMSLIQIEHSHHLIPIAETWLDGIKDYRDELEIQIEQQKEINNPYIVGRPIFTNQQIFVGRKHVTAEIERLLLMPNCPALLLYGQRRMGKTSLLYNLRKIFSSRIVPLFVDGQKVKLSRHVGGFLYLLAQQMWKSAESYYLTFPYLSLDDFSNEPFIVFNDWLDEVETIIAEEPNRSALLMMDEIEAIDQIVEQSRFDDTDLFSMIRHIIQHRPRFKILLASSHDLTELSRWASYLVNVQTVKLSYLKPAEARHLIESPMPGFPLRYEPDALQRILQITNCHPALIQLLCYHLVNVKNTQPLDQRRLVTVADVESTVPISLKQGTSFFFTDIETNQINTTCLTLLRFMAQLGEGKILSRQTLAEHVADESKFEHAMKLLLRRDAIILIHL